MSSLLLAVALAGPGCGGGGRSSSSSSSGAELLAVAFLDPNDVNLEPVDASPAAAPLNQQIRLTFSAPPAPSGVSSFTVPVLDAGGALVSGRYVVQGNDLVFTPELPLREARELSPGVFDNGGAGLEPGKQYALRVGPGTWPGFVNSVAPLLRSRYPDPGDARNVLLPFTTTTVLADFFRGIEKRAPRVVGVEPADGAVGVSPYLYTDPDGVFPASAPMRLAFDAPIQTQREFLDLFQIVDLDDRPAGFPGGLPLGVVTAVVENRIGRAVIEVRPHGILPFGHLLALEHPAELRGLAELRKAGAGTMVASTFTTASTSRTTVEDVLFEGFDDRSRQSQSLADLGTEIPAEWDENDSDTLEPAFVFQGSGELGPFLPQPPADLNSPVTVVLDTSSQAFPLLDGSTPQAPAGTVILGGVFPFTDIDIPAGVILTGRGLNPLVLSATGSVRIAGTINLAGRDGTEENAFDSGTSALPGGPGGTGGGRGGDGHPLVYLGNIVSFLTMVSPPRGGRGLGASNVGEIGGEGGQSGISDFPNAVGRYSTDKEINCSEGGNHSNGSKPPGGGGGTFLELGSPPVADGRGNVLPDGQGGWVIRTPQDGTGYDVLLGGAGGLSPFPDPLAAYIGRRWPLREVIGGQGGGAGGDGTDAYYCGSWCVKDQDLSNDEVCKLETPLGNPQAFADSVGNSRGGGGGGGGGGLSIKALGPILITGTGLIDASGGDGKGGEQIGCSNWGGGGAGGSGGAALFHSGTSITVNANAQIDVSGGKGARAKASTNAGCNGGSSRNNPGSGGDGGFGIIQFQTPAGTTASVDAAAVLNRNAWVDQTNTVNPAEFTPISIALSEWYDLGRVTQRPPQNTNPVFAFRGLDSMGRVKTDAEGNVVNPGQADIRVDYLGQFDPQIPGKYLPGQEPRANFIPPNAEITLEFQGADAIVEGSKEVDPSSLTSWSPDPQAASGRQFVRYRLTFDIAARPGDILGPFTPRPTVQSVSIHADF